MTCPNCGNNIPGYTKICPTCKLDTEEYTKEYETGDIDENVTQFKKFLSLTEEEKQQQFKQELTEYLENEVSGCTDKCVSDCNDFWSKMD